MRSVLTIWLILAVAVASHAAEERPKGQAAIVNGVEITEEDVNRGMLTVERDLMREGKLPSVAIVPELREQVLEKLIEQELLFQESRRKGIHVDDSLVEEHLQRIRAGFRNEKAYDKSMKEAKFSESLLRDQIRRGMAVQKLLQKHLSGKLDVTESQIRVFYENHLEDFREPQQFGLYHILMYAGAGMDDPRKSLIRQNMEGALERLRRGEDFGTVAKEVSQGRSAQKGGDLGYVEKGILPRELDEVLERMHIGETSPIVETSTGYHIVRLYGIKPERIIPFDEAREASRNRLIDEIGKREKGNYVRLLKDKANIQKHR